MWRSEGLLLMDDLDHEERMNTSYFASWEQATKPAQRRSPEGPAKPNRTPSASGLEPNEPISRVTSGLLVLGEEFLTCPSCG